MARTLEIYEIFENFEKAGSHEEKIKVLKQNESWALKDVLRGALDPKVEWLLPPGEVPYTACEEHNAPSTLLRKNVDFKYCVKGHLGNQIKRYKLEKIFLGIVESIHPKDAKLVCAMINKHLPVKDLTPEVVKEAFPGLL
jgi:hypothetical protein|tara:strand:+ start:1273 stop:1692 length:420 start_codon:yes stop_codon:yes gene_type:complete